MEQWDMCAYRALRNFSELRIRWDIAVLISSSTRIFIRCLLFIPVTTETPALKRYDVIRGNVAQINVETVTTVSCGLWVSASCHCVSL